LLKYHYQRRPHSAELRHRAITKLDSCKQPIAGYRHNAKVRKDVGEIASLEREHDDRKDEPTECEWFYKVTSAIGDNGNPRRHLRDDGGVDGEPDQKMCLRP